MIQATRGRRFVLPLVDQALFALATVLPLLIIAASRGTEAIGGVSAVIAVSALTSIVVQAYLVEPLFWGKSLDAAVVRFAATIGIGLFALAACMLCLRSTLWISQWLSWPAIIVLGSNCQVPLRRVLNRLDRFGISTAASAWNLACACLVAGAAGADHVRAWSIIVVVGSVGYVIGVLRFICIYQRPAYRPVILRCASVGTGMIGGIAAGSALVPLLVLSLFQASSGQAGEFRLAVVPYQIGVQLMSALQIAVLARPASVKAARAERVVAPFVILGGLISHWANFAGMPALLFALVLTRIRPGVLLRREKRLRALAMSTSVPAAIAIILVMASVWPPSVGTALLILFLVEAVTALWQLAEASRAELNRPGVRAESIV